MEESQVALNNYHTAGLKILVLFLDLLLQN